MNLQRTVQHFLMSQFALHPDVSASLSHLHLPFLHLFFLVTMLSDQHYLRQSSRYISITKKKGGGIDEKTRGKKIKGVRFREEIWKSVVCYIDELKTYLFSSSPTCNVSSGEQLAREHALKKISRWGFSITSMSLASAGRRWCNASRSSSALTVDHTIHYWQSVMCLPMLESEIEKNGLSSRGSETTILSIWEIHIRILESALETKAVLTPISLRAFTSRMMTDPQVFHRSYQLWVYTAK